ncbi:hypothetical protein QCA50_013597 [Cerrena zonata]|uniref:BTB domain-containing protein n=1 Tax=Cerrena zonata TaxID=2478898 RepID=A0AAW0G2Q3_9APHY
MSSETTPTENTLKKCPDLWFEDGTIILQTMDDDQQSFRVYPGILSMQSPVFKTLFTLPQSKCESSNTYEGCIIVQLQDTSQTLRHFLRAIFDWSYFPTQSNAHNYRAVLSVLKLSTKYEVTSLRSSAITVLSERFPTHFEITRFNEPGKAIVHPFQAANAALESNAMILLPSALLMCCAYKTETLLNGILLKNGVRYKLCDANLVTVLAARTKLTSVARRVVFRFAFYPLDINGCHFPEACRLGKIKWAESLERADGWIDLFAEIPTEIYRECRKHAVCVRTAAHSALWDALPGVFGLGDNWSVLKKLTTQ